MKKILTIITMALTTSFAIAGDDGNDIKNFRFGLKVTPSVNWFKPDGTIMSGNGAGVKFGGGLILEFRLSKIISIQTGLQLDLDGGKIKYNNGGTQSPNSNWVGYYYSNPDQTIVTPSSGSSSSPNYTYYQLNDRQYKVTYVTIPLTLKMKTKEIGMFTYYGQIGVNTSIRWTAKATDDVTVSYRDPSTSIPPSPSIPPSNNGAAATLSNLDITKDLSFIHETLNFGLGAEMNLSGSTSLTFGLNYLLGFTNTVVSNSKYLEKHTNDTNFSSINSNTYTIGAMPQSLKSNAVVLTVGVLF
jgi:hypothetical protein